MQSIKKVLRATLLLLLAGLLLTACVPALRSTVLGGAGAMLVHADALEAADAIVIAVDGEAPEVLEAADLVHAGMARAVWVFSDPPDAIGQEFARRGLAYADKATVAVQTLQALGVPDAHAIQPPVDGSNGEAQRLPAWCREKGFQRVIFVTAADHSRRMKRMLGRSNAGAGAADIRVRYSRYAPFQPADWWTNRRGIRTFIVEWQKLLLDLINSP